MLKTSTRVTASLASQALDVTHVMSASHFPVIVEMDVQMRLASVGRNALTRPRHLMPL
jgi:hypothetical protein